MNTAALTANPTQEQVKHLIQAIDNVLATMKSPEGDADPMTRILNGPAAGDAMILMSSLTSNATQRLMGMMQGASTGGDIMNDVMSLLDLKLDQAPVFVAAAESIVVLPMGKLIMAWAQEDGVTKVDSFSFKPNIWWFITHPVTAWRLFKARQKMKKAAAA